MLVLQVVYYFQRRSTMVFAGMIMVSSTTGVHSTPPSFLCLTSVGATVGLSDGVRVGDVVGLSVGSFVGMPVGETVQNEVEGQLG
jgi:hypothetical protein